MAALMQQTLKLMYTIIIIKYQYLWDPASLSPCRSLVNCYVQLYAWFYAIAGIHCYNILRKKHSMPAYCMLYYSNRVYQQKCWKKANECSGNLCYDKRTGMCLTVIHQLMKSY
jgi:hypothetical protein